MIDGDNLENRVKYLDLSHNQIVDISLQVFVYRAGVQEDSAWTIITLDLSYNKISDVSSFPSSLMRGSFKKLFLQHNQIVHLGTTTPNALQGITVGAFEELNLEFNQITQMPYLNFDGSPSSADINVKNNRINTVTPKTGYYWLTVINFENNELTAFTFEMIDNNYDTEIFNFNNNKITEISAFTTSDPTNAYYSVRKLYFDNNEIASVAQEAFNYFIHLEVLVLSNNRIPTLRFDYIFPDYRLGVLTTLNVENNELTSVMDRTADFPATRTPVLNMNVKGNV